MALITDGLVNHLDASLLLNSGFVDGQNLIGASIPDLIDPAGWYGSAGYDMRVVASGQNDKTVIRMNTGNITFNNLTKFSNYSSLSVIIAAKRTGSSYSRSWMGLFSIWYNYKKSGLTVTNQANAGDYNGWGTYNETVTTKSTSAMDLDTPIIVGATTSPSSPGTLYTNGINTGAFTDSYYQPYFGIGGFEYAKGFFIGDIYEVLVYNRSLTSSEMQENANYLAGKWYFPQNTWASSTYTWANIPYTWSEA